MQSFAIIPAAGRSQRMGTSKLLLPWGSKTIIEHVLDTWAQSGVDYRLVIVPPDDVQLSAICHQAGAIVCVPPVSPPEMKDSVAAGLQEIEARFHPHPDDAWLLAPADLPLLSAELIRRLLAEYVRQAVPIVAPQLPDGRLGHPMLFSWRLAVEVPGLTEGVRQLKDRYSPVTVPWSAVDCVTDVDTIEEYRHLHNRYHPHSQQL